MAPNLLFICSDQHNPRIGGYAGHPIVQTPNLDRLAEGGAVLRRAFCTSPICTPSRMSMLTGRYIHRIGVPNNKFPLDPSVPTWARILDQAGIRSTMLGKMDMCGEYQDAGFTDHKIIRRRPANPMLIADPGAPRLSAPLESRLLDGVRSWGAVEEFVRHAGPRTAKVLPEHAERGESDHFIGNYDHDMIVTDWAVEYLRERGRERAVSAAHGGSTIGGDAAAQGGSDASGTGPRPAQPWALYVGLVYPHAPFTVPSQYFDMYADRELDLPDLSLFPNGKLNPAMGHVQRAFQVGHPSREDLQRTVAAYYGMVTCMDAMIGRILDELETQGLADDTYVIYTSDHGESLGEHGLFFKMNPFNSSVGVPLIIRGPNVAPATRVAAPVDLTDVTATILDVYRCDHNGGGLDAETLLPLVTLDAESSRARPAGALSAPHSAPAPPAAARSEASVGRQPRLPSRRKSHAFSEFHGHLNRYDWFMVARDNYKYVWYDGLAPELYDLDADPGEEHDLAAGGTHGDVVAEMDDLLRSICDPEAVALEARRQLGLIGPDGEELAHTTTVAAARERFGRLA